MSKHTVNIWNGDPALGNDNCATGDDFESADKAMAVFDDPASWLKESKCAYYCGLGDPTSELWVELDSPELGYRTRCFQKATRRDNSMDEWRREQAMEAGMAFGCDGYNDVMGY
jgi:hypothetical protein